MSKSRTLILVFLIALVAVPIAPPASVKAATDLETYQDPASGPGGGGDSDGWPFESQAEAVADAVVDAVTCVTDAYADILQDARDLIDVMIALEKDLVKLITESAKSVVDLYLEYKTFFFQAIAGVVRDIADHASAAEQVVEEARSYSAGPSSESGATGSDASPAVPFERSADPVPAQPREAAPTASAAAGQGSASDRQTVTDEMMEALEQGLARIREMQREVLQVLKVAVENAVEEAINKVQAKVEAAVKLAEEILLLHLRVWLDTVKKFLSNPCDFANPIGTAGGVMSQIEQDMDGVIAAITALRDDVPGAFDPVRSPLDQAQANAEAAAGILRDMRAVLDQKSDAAVRTLNQTIAASRLAVRAAGPDLVMSAAVAASAERPAVDRSTADAIRTTRLLRERVGRMESRLQERIRSDLAARQKLAADLDGIFNGRTPQQSEAAKQAILARIRSKYGNDPGLLADARSFLDREAATRVSATATKRPPAGSASRALSADSGNAAPVPATGPALTRRRLVQPRSSLSGSPGSAPPAMPRPSPAPADPGMASRALPPSGAAADEPALKRSPAPPQAQEAAASPRTAALPRRAGPSVTGVTPLARSLERGGPGQYVNITGTGLAGVTFEVVKGGQGVSDVTVQVVSASDSLVRVSLAAPAYSPATGTDYALNVKDGGRVIRQLGFAVQAPAAPAPSGPVMGPRPTPGTMRR